MAAYGTAIWIPRAISVWGEIIRLFDPSCHEELPLAFTASASTPTRESTIAGSGIRRPTIVVGGELTMENFEITSTKTRASAKRRCK